jgi:hypothetical protein
MIGQEDEGGGSVIFEIFKVIGKFVREIGKRVLAYIDNY